MERLEIKVFSPSFFFSSSFNKKSVYTISVYNFIYITTCVQNRYDTLSLFLQKNAIPFKWDVHVLDNELSCEIRRKNTK